MIIDADKVAGIWTITGTNTGHGSTPPTGKSIEVKGISILHFKDGKIVDEWISGNELLWFQQLGYTLKSPVNEE
jgi:predicted ester cyclase